MNYYLIPPKHKLHSTKTRYWAKFVPYSWNTLTTSIRTIPSTIDFKKLLNININIKYIWTAQVFIRFISTVRSPKTEKCKTKCICNVKQHVLCNIHYLGNTLYLVLTNSDSDIIYGIPIKSKVLTDHFTITFRLKLSNTKIKRALINNFSNDINQFQIVT